MSGWAMFAAGVLCAPLAWLVVVHALLWWASRLRQQWDREPEWYDIELDDPWWGERTDTRPVFNEGKCPECGSIDTRARANSLTADLWHSHCEDCRHRWDWTEADVERSLQAEKDAA